MSRDFDITNVRSNGFKKYLVFLGNKMNYQIEN